eukprot:scaffold84502_cov48-Phaeocystis_antarctica.AAC.1
MEERLTVEVLEAGKGGGGGGGGGGGVAVEWSGGPTRLDALATPSLSRGTPGLRAAPLTTLHACVLAGRQAHRQGKAQGRHPRRLAPDERRAPRPSRGTH